MPAPPALLALDWGTSSLRGYLLDNTGAVLDSRAAPHGIMHLPPGGFPGAFAALAGEWLAAHPGLPAIACGMVGSRQGWREVPYRDAPAGLAELAAGLVPVDAVSATLHLVPGVRQGGARPDVMRGEETQALGLPETASARLVLPGTHSKWVSLEHGRVSRFSTYMTGELFALLRGHSILGRPAQEAGGAAAPDWDAFARGVAAVRETGRGISPLLFSVRTLVLDGALSAAGSLDYLSGLLIGDELRCALEPGTDRLTLIGEAALCDRYGRALALFGVGATVLEGAAVAGLWRIAVAAGLVRKSAR